MKFFLLKGAVLIGFILFQNPIHAQTKVVAEVSNARNDDGVCRVCLYDSPKGYGDENSKPLICKEATVKQKKATVIFDNIKPGTYAALVLHDANKNGKMDKNFLGIPKEGYGASLNNLPAASAPKFEDNQFTIKENTTTTLLIRLRNM